MIHPAIRTLGLATLLALVAGGALAGSDERKGTGGAPELSIAVGPRGTALGSAVSTDVSGAEATFWNPAGLANLTGTEALFSHTAYFADMHVGFAAIAAPAGRLGVLGFSTKVLSVGDVIVTTEAAPDGTGEVLQPTFTVLGLSWGKAFTDRVNFGATMNIVNESVASMHAGGVAFDFGAQYNAGWRGLKLAMTMKNFGSTMHYDGDNLDVSVAVPGQESGASNRVLRFSSANFEMPSYFTLAGGCDLQRMGGNSLRLLGCFQNNNFVGDNFSSGLEWNVRNQFALRGSWFGTLDTQSDPNSGDLRSTFHSGDDLYTGVALGAGVDVRTGNAYVGVDLTWRPVRSPFDDIVDLGVRVRF